MLDYENPSSDASEEHDTVIYMDDSTLYEVIGASPHAFGNSIGTLQYFWKVPIELPDTWIEYWINIGRSQVSRVTSYKLLGLWVDNDLKWSSNTENIVKKASKRLHLLKILRRYGAPKEHLLTLYCLVIRPVLDNNAQIWNGSLTKMQSKN